MKGPFCGNDGERSGICIFIQNIHQEPRRLARPVCHWPGPYWYDPKDCVSVAEIWCAGGFYLEYSIRDKIFLSE